MNKYGKQIAVRVTPHQEARLVEIQRQLAARSPGLTVSLTRAATITLSKALEAMPATKDTTD
jgi:hypothetical protein